MEVDTAVKLTGDEETGATDTSTATSQWDPQLLQLPECSPVSLRGHVAEELFSLWLSLPDTARLVRSLIGDMQAGNPINVLGMATMNLSVSGTSGSMFPIGSVPPLSPRGSSASSKHKGSPFSRSPLKVVAEPVREVIPQFYFQNGRPPSKELKEQFISEINHFFNDHPDGLRINEFKFITREVFKLPSFLSYAIFSKIDTDCTGRVTRDMFAKYWMDSNFLTMDTATRLFNIIKHPNHKYLVPADFRAVLLELLATHPGLEFLQNSPEFQERYAETVIYRIFYHINRSGNGRLTLRELKRSDLIAALQHADQEEDINKVIRYFSYEHFYVIYCKFWELDADHDFLIDRESLIKYGNHALTYRIVDRIFSQAGRTFASKTEGKMNYEDFVYFMLSEEDKSSLPGLEYWFKCIDLDGNGILTPNEMQFFYEEQLHRMECMGQEPVLFEDILCQIVDMISPETEDCITLRDLLRSKLSGNVFNILFNLNKFIAFECRDPFLARQEREDPTLTDWDRYAHKEYIRLTMEDAENWDESSMEAPF